MRFFVEGVELIFQCSKKLLQGSVYDILDVFFPGVFIPQLQSVTGACSVTTDLILRE